MEKFLLFSLIPVEASEEQLVLCPVPHISVDISKGKREHSPAQRGSGSFGRWFWAEVSYSCSCLPRQCDLPMGSQFTDESRGLISIVYHSVGVSWVPGELPCAICWGVPCSLSTPWKTAAEDSRRYQLVIKDQEYYVGSWNKNSKLYCRVMNLQAGFWKGLSAGWCGVLFYHLVALWDSAHGGNGLFQGREIFINSINYYQFVCHLWSPIELPGLREAIKNSRDADFHMVGRG